MSLLFTGLEFHWLGCKEKKFLILFSNSVWRVGYLGSSQLHLSPPPPPQNKCLLSSTKFYCTCIGHGQVSGSLQNTVSNKLSSFSVKFLNSGLKRLWCSLFLGSPSSNNGPQCFMGTGDEFNT